MDASRRLWGNSGGGNTTKSDQQRRQKGARGVERTAGKSTISVASATGGDPAVAAGRSDIWWTRCLHNIGAFFKKKNSMTYKIMYWCEDLFKRGPGRGRALRFKLHWLPNRPNRPTTGNSIFLLQDGCCMNTAPVGCAMARLMRGYVFAGGGLLQFYKDSCSVNISMS